MLCEDASRTLHRFIDSPSYEGRIASSILHESSRITPAMAQSPFWILVQSSDDSFDEKVGGKKPDDGLRLVLVLLCLLLVTFVFILIILYWRYSITASRSRTPQIILGDYIESREAYVHWFVCFMKHLNFVTNISASVSIHKACCSRQPT